MGVAPMTRVRMMIRVTHPLGPTQSMTTGALRSARSEVDRILGELAQAEEGSRNDALNRAAFQLGQIVGAGDLDGKWAFSQL
jgi:hypothetical protein